MNASRSETLRQVITSEQIQKRVKELARQISDDYKGQTIQMLAVLENAFMFLADLVRALEVPVDRCQCILEAGGRGNREAHRRLRRGSGRHQNESHPGDGAPSGYPACRFHGLLGSSRAGEPDQAKSDYMRFHTHVIANTMRFVRQKS